MKALWHIRVGMTALWLVGTNPVSASMPDTTLVRKGETLSARQETAQSLLMLNRFIDDAATRPLARADSLLLLRALSGNARNYQVLGNNHQALAYFQRAISLAKLLDEQRRLAQLYNNVFGIYYQQREYTQAEDLLLLSLDINKKVHDSTAIRNNYNNLGLLALGSKEYGKVLGYYNLAVDFTPQSDKVGRSLILTNRADLYDVMGQYAHAERELTEALRLQHGLPLTAQTIQTSLNMALLKARLGKRTEAKALQPAIYRALHTLPLAAQVNSLAQLADIHFALGDSLAGLRDILRFQRLDDSLRRATNTSQLQQLLVAYEHLNDLIAIVYISKLGIVSQQCSHAFGRRAITQKDLYALAVRSGLVALSHIELQLIDLACIECELGRDNPVVSLEFALIIIHVSSLLLPVLPSTIVIVSIDDGPCVIVFLLVKRLAENHVARIGKCGRCRKGCKSKSLQPLSKTFC